MSGRHKAGGQGADHIFILQFGYPVAARTHQEQTRHLLLVALLAAGHKEVHSPDLVNKPLVNQKIQCPIDGGW